MTDSEIIPGTTLSTGAGSSTTRCEQPVMNNANNKNNGIYLNFLPI